MKQALFVLLFLMAVLFAAESRQASAASRSYEDVFGYAYSNHDNFSRDTDAGPRAVIQVPGSGN